MITNSGMWIPSEARIFFHPHDCLKKLWLLAIFICMVKYYVIIHRRLLKFTEFFKKQLDDLSSLLSLVTCLSFSPWLTWSAMTHTKATCFIGHGRQRENYFVNMCCLKWNCPASKPSHVIVYKWPLTSVVGIQPSDKQAVVWSPRVLMYQWFLNTGPCTSYLSVCKSFNDNFNLIFL